MEFDMAAPGFERIVTPETELGVIAHNLSVGEGPVWNRRTGQLFWVSIIGNTIWKWTPGVGREIVMHPSYKADGMTFDQQGRLVVAGWGWRCVWRMELDGTIKTLCSHYEGKKLNSPNDIVVKSDGSIYFTDPSGALFSVEMHGEDVQQYLDFHGVFRISPQGDTTLVIRDCVYPNGLAFSPNESMLYINDSRQNLIQMFDVRPDGTLKNGRLFYKLTGKEPGHADGMKVDTEGNVYCTGPAGIHVISSSGSLLGRLKIPGNVTNMGWGDSDWRGLYITTDTSVFRVRLGVAGIPVW
jgi:sugar lactone lactonase YvrE